MPRKKANGARTRPLDPQRAGEAKLYALSQRDVPERAAASAELLRRASAEGGTKGDVLARLLAPGVKFTLLMQGAIGFPAVNVFTCEDAAVAHRGGVSVHVRVPRTRRRGTVRLPAEDKVYVWLGEVELRRPGLMAMGDDALLGQVSRTAAVPPVVAGRLRDPA